MTGWQIASLSLSLLSLAFAIASVVFATKATRIIERIKR